MVNILIDGGTVVTMNPDRDVIKEGAVAIEGSRIVDVGRAERLRDEHRADREIDASGHVLFPGFTISHAHVPGILLRGGVATDRGHYDGLFNMKKPFAAAMTAEEHAVAAALYCTEALRSGVTTLVENGTGKGGWGYPRDILESKFAVYEAAGMRNVYGHSFIDAELPPETAAFLDVIRRKEPTAKHPVGRVGNTDEALKEIEGLIERYHGTAEGRQHIWPAPISPRSTTPQGLLGAYELAEKHGVMTTTHVSESAPDNDAVPGPLSMVEYLYDIGYLGERALIAHAVHVNDRDISMLAETDTKVAHNPVTNLALASGVAPVPAMLRQGVTVGLGTDSPWASDTVNLIYHMHFAAMVHKGAWQDAGAMTAEKVVEMATIDNARAIGMEDELGSLEPGKTADVVVVNFEHPHLTPSHDPVSALVYQAQGYEVETVVCDGRIVVENGRVPGIEETHPDLREEAATTVGKVLDRAGLTGSLNRPWRSIG